MNASDMARLEAEAAIERQRKADWHGRRVPHRELDEHSKQEVIALAAATERALEREERWNERGFRTLAELNKTVAGEFSSRAFRAARRFVA